jgi:hypothetical protein
LLAPALKGVYLFFHPLGKGQTFFKIRVQTYTKSAEYQKQENRKALTKQFSIIFGRFHLFTVICSPKKIITPY